MWFNSAGRPAFPLPRMCNGCAERLQWEEESRKAREEAERKKADRPDVLALAEAAGGNPYEYGRFRLDTFPANDHQRKGLRAAREWRDAILSTEDKYASVRGLYLCSPEKETGTAKTQILHLVLFDLLDAGWKPGVDVIFDDATAFVAQIQDCYNSKASAWALVEPRIEARVWMLDDFGTERASEDVVRWLTAIFNRRQGRPTGITSNLTPPELFMRHEEYFRLASRFGTANMRTVGVGGPDMRFRRAA